MLSFFSHSSFQCANILLVAEGRKTALNRRFALKTSRKVDTELATCSRSSSVARALDTSCPGRPGCSYATDSKFNYHLLKADTSSFYVCWDVFYGFDSRRKRTWGAWTLAPKKFLIPSESSFRIWSVNIT